MVLVGVHRSATKVFSRLFSSSSCFSLLASLNLIPPYWDRQRSNVDSLPSKAYNITAAFLPPLSIASASRSLATISAERCFFRRFVAIESLLAFWAVDLHTGWFRISKADQGQTIFSKQIY